MEVQYNKWTVCTNLFNYSDDCIRNRNNSYLLNANSAYVENLIKGFSINFDNLAACLSFGNGHTESGPLLKREYFCLSIRPHAFTSIKSRMILISKASVMMGLCFLIHAWTSLTSCNCWLIQHHVINPLHRYEI